MNLCTFPGCDRDKGAYKTYCGPHMKQRKAGKPMTLLQNRGGIWTLENLLLRTDKVGNCLLWAEQRNRYTNVWHGGAPWKAHRLSYHLATGDDISDGHIHHTCANTRCINPDHLQRASQAENTLEMLARRDYEARIAALEARVKELETNLDIQQMSRMRTTGRRSA